MADGIDPRPAGRVFSFPFIARAEGLRARRDPVEVAVETKVEAARSGARRGLLLLGILLIAINLRPALASVGPLVGEIRADTGLSHAALGLLTALPLLAFAGVSALSSAVSRLLGLGGALATALVLLIAGASVRAVPSVGLLYAGTLTLGTGIALGNVLLPALVKREFSHRAGLLTSLYSSVLGLGACIGAGVAVPLSRSIGWQSALAIWAVPAIVALLVWLPQIGSPDRSAGDATAQAGAQPGMLRSNLAWQLAIFMGLQSLTFYVVIAWLPDLLQTRGMTPIGAGWTLAISQVAGVIGSAAIPLLVGKATDQRPVVAVLAFLEAVALLGLLFDTGFGLTVVFVSVLGFVLGGTLSIALLLIVLRSPDTATTTRLSGMVQAVGYTVAAVGPVVFGWLYEQTAAWTIPLVFLFIVLAGKFATGFRAGRAGRVLHG